MTEEQMDLIENEILPPEECPLCGNTGQVIDVHDPREWFKPCPRGCAVRLESPERD